MKVFVFFAVIAYVSASSYGGSSGSSSGSSSYGGSSMPALPCPKNYMFSCQPSLSPAPCSQASYGSTGAYSEPVPNYYGVPVNYPVNYPYQGVNGFYGYGQGVGVQDYRY